MLGSIFEFGPAKLLHITGTIFFLPVVELIISCCFKGYWAYPAKLLTTGATLALS